MLNTGNRGLSFKLFFLLVFYISLNGQTKPLVKFRVGFECFFINDMLLHSPVNVSRLDSLLSEKGKPGPEIKHGRQKGRKKNADTSAADNFQTLNYDNKGLTIHYSLKTYRYHVEIMPLPGIEFRLLGSEIQLEKLTTKRLDSLIKDHVEWNNYEVIKGKHHYSFYSPFAFTCGFVFNRRGTMLKSIYILKQHEFVPNKEFKSSNIKPFNETEN